MTDDKLNLLSFASGKGCAIGPTNVELRVEIARTFKRKGVRGRRREAEMSMVRDCFNAARHVEVYLVTARKKMVVRYGKDAEEEHITHIQIS